MDGKFYYFEFEQRFRVIKVVLDKEIEEWVIEGLEVVCKGMMCVVNL